ncbi:fumarylacetoacetate hydrolase family protein [Sphingomonas sp. GB1N7]
MHIARFRHDRTLRWGVIENQSVVPLHGEYPTTRDLIERGEDDRRGAIGRSAAIPLSAVTLVSPITAPCRILCQGANYRQHMIESGLDPDAKGYNLFFDKSDCTVNDPNGSVTTPTNVKLLDYEIELGLVFGTTIDAPLKVTRETLADHVFGFVMANDVTARDVQLSETQWFKGKSYRGFCPFGPYIAIPERDEFAYIDALSLSLSVNGEVRQRDTTANLVHKPAPTIAELSTFSDIVPGDILLTGTPHGCALSVPSPMVRRIASALLPEKKLWEVFLKRQRNRPYLKVGDLMTATIASDDGVINLGQQNVTIS